MFKKTTTFSAAKIFLAVSAIFSILGGIAAAALADFNPNKIIEDRQFTDTQTFGGAAGIQQFLALKGSVLANTDPNFLLKLKEPQDSKLKSGLNDPEPSLGRLRTAAELIWDSATKNGLNPQVILVTLQKEQGLISGNFRNDTAVQRALDHALGFNCTDANGCDQLFSGFYYQLFGNFDAQGNRYIGAPASLMRSFNTPGGRGPGVDAAGETFSSPLVRTSRVGDSIILDNTQGPPNNAAPMQTVTLSNLATAALYRYTPHVYNGNYNFWKFFSTWFKYANGTLLKIQGDNNIYIINNGAKQLMVSFVLATRGVNPQTANILTVSPTELSDYDNSPPLAPADNTVVFDSADSTKKLFVFENGVRHPVSNFVLKQRGLDPNLSFGASQTELGLFQTGALLAPKDGTLLKGDASGTVYVIANGKRMALTAFTFKQYGYSFNKVVTLPQAEVDAYDNGGFMLPKNGTLLTVGADPQVFQVQDQILHKVSQTVFKLSKFNAKNVVHLNSDQIANATVDGYLAPPEGTYFKTELANNYYLYKNGTKHSISVFVLQQRGAAKLAVTLGLEEGLSLPDGPALPPRDGTLIKGDSASLTIYVIKNGQKVALDYNTWVKKYGKRKPTVLPQAEVDSYPSPQAQIQQ